VASLYRKPKGTTLDERLLGTERLVGEATALTSDGWFVTSAASIGSLHLTDLVLWYDGAPYVIEKGIADALNDTVYVKVGVSGVTPSAFARVSDLVSGSELWMETRPQEFTPSLVVNVRGRVSPNAAASSEEATRRILISGTSMAGDQGSPVWDPNGSLVGIIESGAGERVRLIPASTIAASFASLLSTGDIRHAALGIQAWDVAAVRSDVSRAGIPRIGAWVRDEKGKNYAKLKSGDVILRVEHDILDGTVDLGEVLADYRPGAAVTLRVLRDGKDMDVPVTLGTMVTSQILK
jgi:S1-C subfamily serine protease